MASTEQLRQRTRGVVGNREADPALRERVARGPDARAGLRQNDHKDADGDFGAAAAA